MCGIVGYTGYQTAVPVLLEGLRRLEYRGYDSAGIAVFEENALYLKKKAGELEVLVNTINGQSFNGKSGIGHTRWATHGAPTDLNAHPHIDCTGRFACVHNGIIENYSSLRQWLKAEGHMFRSETDTEVLPHLIEHYYNFDGDLYEAVKRAVSRLHGSFAFLAIALNEPGRLIAVRQDSPLVIGLGEGENFIASDIPAILPYTRKVYLLDDGQMAEVTDSRVNIFDFNGRSIAKDVFHVNWEAEQAEKGGYDHFMIKEICEQPKAVRETLRGRISPDGRRVVFDELSLEADYVRNLNKIFVVACGTAYHAGVVGKYVIEKLVRIPVEADIASEFRYREPIIGGNDLVILVSQSGETADTRAALREAKSRGAHVIAITNVVGSSIAREADDVIYTWAGPEIAVASTKAYVTQLTAFYLLALWLGEARGTLAKGDQQAILWGLGNLPEQIAQTLENTECIAQLARRYADREDVFFIGRGLDYAVAMEGGLKLKEISYIHAEAYAAGELKHGTLALVVPGVPVFALATQPELYDKTVSNIKEVKARGADVIAVALNDHCEIREVADEVICLP
ncbi:glutamine--fructose-6-phosphate transaminase (isomerizing), partial [Desulforudis sp. 1190]